MLVLTRKLGESIAIDDHIKIRVVQIKGKQVRLGIEAPKDTRSIVKKFTSRFRIKISSQPVFRRINPAALLSY